MSVMCAYDCAMKLSDQAIQEFREIFAREFKRDLSEEEARDRAEAFMRLILLLLRPTPSHAERDRPGTPNGSVDETIPSATL